MESTSTNREIRISTQLMKWLIPLLVLGISMVAVLWIVDIVMPDNLLYEIKWNHPIDLLETSWLYLILHAFILIPILALSFDKKVAYYKSWKPLIKAISIVGLFFIVWDVYFTHIGVWGFNENYITGYKLFLLPIEEWLFFLTVPFACVFIYECLNAYITKDHLASLDTPITLGLLLLFLIIGILNWGRIYTCTTFLLTSSFLLFHFLFIKNTYRTRFYLAYLVSLVPFLIINGILTGGYTQDPIVLYNPEEYLGVRITSVPLDDSVYSLLLLLMTTTLFERFR